MKLKKFTEFTDSLLPHEALLLEGSAQFQDHDRSVIFETVKYNALSKDKKRNSSPA